MTTIRRVIRPHLILEVILVIGILIAYLLVVTRGQIFTTIPGSDAHPAQSTLSTATASAWRHPN